MRALVHDPTRPRGIAFAEVPPPVPSPAQALVQVAACSLNSGEVKYMAEMRKPGEVPGWDAAGVVVRAAADGSGPKEGTRVTSFHWSGAWAELRAAGTADLAVVPEGVDLGDASALPVAGVTALRALRALGSVVGRRVLVTGASGGVGRFAVQLARRAGALVVASVGSAARGAGLRELGADEVVVGLTGVAGPVFGVIENLGGPALAEALALVERGGSVQSVGSASGLPSTIDFETERRRAGDRRLEVFTIGAALGGDLAYLLSLLARGELDPQVGWRGSWDRAAEAASALVERRVAGKAVLEVSGAKESR